MASRICIACRFLRTGSGSCSSIRIRVNWNPSANRYEEGCASFYETRAASEAAKKKSTDRQQAAARNIQNNEDWQFLLPVAVLPPNSRPSSVSRPLVLRTPQVLRSNIEIRYLDCEWRPMAEVLETLERIERRDDRGAFLCVYSHNEVRYLGRHAAPGTAVYWGKRDQPCDGMVNPHTLDRGADGKEIPGSTTLDRLFAGQYRVLLGSQKSSEGTNLERNLSFVAAMGPQPSQENFLQQAGRGGRRIPGKVVPFLILVNMEHEYAKMAVGVGSMRQANKDKKEEIKDLYSGRTCLVQAIESAFNTRAKDLGPCRMRCSVCDGRIFTLPPALPRAEVTDGLKAVLERVQPWVVWEVVQVGGRNAASMCWVLWAREGGIVAALQVEVPAPLIGH